MAESGANVKSSLRGIVIGIAGVGVLLGLLIAGSLVNKEAEKRDPAPSPSPSVVSPGPSPVIFQGGGSSGGGGASQSVRGQQPAGGVQSGQNTQGSTNTRNPVLQVNPPPVNLPGVTVK